MISIGEPLASWFLLVGRILLALVFLVSAAHKAIWYRKAVAEFRHENVPWIPVTLPVTIALHTFASFAIIAGVFVVEAALALAAFTLVATVKVHNFWSMQGEQRLEISRIAMGNLALVGGLLVLAAVGPGELP